jgi:AcrR family transcriptional regulator
MDMKNTETHAGKRPKKAVRSARTKRRRSREELTPEARDSILAAAAKVVGEHGYTEASIARITKAAGIAQGTFYLYFTSRQELFDQLLPHTGTDMLVFIRTRIAGAADVYEMEERGFRAFFDYLKEHPGFIRVLNEAESAAPAAHAAHFQLLADHYRAALARGLSAGQICNLGPDEMETIAYMLMAARSYLHLRYIKSRKDTEDLPEPVVQTYMKVVRNGLRQLNSVPATDRLEVNGFRDAQKAALEEENSRLKRLLAEAILKQSVLRQRMDNRKRAAPVKPA